METTEQITEPLSGFLDFIVSGGGALIGGLFFVLWIVFVFYVARDMFLAQRRVPRELKGIREALERIATQLEQRK